MEDDDFDALYLDLMKEFLSTATPMQWLAVVTTMNYDNGSALPDWISKYPKLEPAVAKALYWFEQASLRGHAAAQHRLGVMFFRGEGVKANNVQAYIVLKMAAVNGEDEALDTADRVSAQMRRDELEIATQVLGQIFRDYLMQLQAADAPLIP